MDAALQLDRRHQDSWLYRPQKSLFVESPQRARIRNLIRRRKGKKEKKERLSKMKLDGGSVLEDGVSQHTTTATADTTNSNGSNGNGNSDGQSQAQAHGAALQEWVSGLWSSGQLESSQYFAGTVAAPPSGARNAYNAEEFRMLYYGVILIVYLAVLFVIFFKVVK